MDVAVRATGCCRGATTDGSAHTRGRQDQPNDKDQWAWVSADTVLTTGCNPWVLAIAKRPSSRQSTTPAALGQWGVAGLLGPAGDCTPAIEAVNGRQKRNELGLCAAMGPCNPQATHTDGPLTERRLRVQVALAETASVDAGCLVSAGILGFLAASPGGPRIRSRCRPLRA